MYERHSNGVKVRADGCGDAWAQAHRKLGPTFNMQDIDALFGIMAFGQNTGDKLFLEYVPDNDPSGPANPSPPPLHHKSRLVRHIFLAQPLPESDTFVGRRFLARKAMFAWGFAGFLAFSRREKGIG